MSNVTELCALCLKGAESKKKLEPYHPMIEGFSNYIEDFKRRSEGNVMSTMRIKLPFEVKPDVNEQILA